MARNNTITISVLADTKKFSRAMSDLGRKTGLTKLGGDFKALGSKVNGFLVGALKYAAALGGILVGLALKGGFERALAIEDSEAKLKGLGYNTKQIDKIMTNALASVKGTAFGLDEAATAAAGAIASGVQPGKDLERTLKLVGDAATIAGSDFGEMGAIFNKVAANGKVTMQEINQLADRGIPIMQWLADQYGVTAEEAKKMVSSGKVDFEDFRKAIEENIAGAALESGETTRGSFKNMLAAISRVGVGLLSGVFPMFKKVFQGITEFLGPLEEKAGEVGKAFGEWIERIIPNLKTAVENRLVPAWERFNSFLTNRLIPNLREMRDFFTEHRDLITKIAEAVGPAAGILLGLASAFSIVARVFAIIRLVTPIGILLALVTALVYAWQNSETFRDKVKAVWDKLAEVFTNVWNNFLKPVLDALREAWEELWPAIKEVGDKIWDLVRTIFGDIGGSLADNEEGWSGWVEAVKSAIREVTDTLARVLKKISEFLDKVKAWWKRHGEDVKKLVTETWNIIKERFGAGLRVIWGVIQLFLGIITGDWKLFKDGVVNIAKGLWGLVVSLFRQAVSTLKFLLAAAWQSIKDKLKQRWNEIVAYFKTVPIKILTAFFSLPGKMLELGWNAGKALANAFKVGWNTFIGGKGISWTMPDVLGGKTIGITIPKLHDGGLFKAPPGQHEGLAWLRNNERVLTPEQDRRRNEGQTILQVFIDGKEAMRQEIKRDKRVQKINLNMAGAR